METYCFSIKNNTTSWEKLWDIQQRITCYSKSSYKVETISTGCHRKIWSLDRLWKPQVFPRTTQT